MTLTLGQLADHAKLTVDSHLRADMEIPVLAGPQAQGDLLVLPAGLAQEVTVGHDGWSDVPRAGFELVRGEAGGNVHLLIADPDTCKVSTNFADPTGLAVAVVECTAPAHLIHREHGANSLAPGRYIIRRQREQAEVVRLVQD